MQIIFALMSIVLVVIQGGGAGLSGNSSSYANYFASKRGFDKYLFYLTIISVVSFVSLSALSLFVR